MSWIRRTVLNFLRQPFEESVPSYGSRPEGATSRRKQVVRHDISAFISAHQHPFLGRRLVHVGSETRRGFLARGVATPAHDKGVDEQDRVFSFAEQC